MRKKVAATKASLLNMVSLKLVFPNGVTNLAKNARKKPRTIHKYMNTELGLHSIVRPKKLKVKLGKPHKVFPNLLHQDFKSDKPNKKWCTDFTYLFLKNGEVR